MLEPIYIEQDFLNGLSISEGSVISIRAQPTFFHTPDAADDSKADEMYDNCFNHLTDQTVYMMFLGISNYQETLRNNMNNGKVELWAVVLLGDLKTDVNLKYLFEHEFIEAAVLCP